MKKTTIIMGIVALLLGFLALVRGGWELFLSGLLQSGKTLVLVTPLLLLAFAASGLISVVVSKDSVSKWLGKEAGWKGIFFGTLAGALVPGGPFVFYPLAATFLVAGAEIGTVISFITAKTVMSISNFPIEVALINFKVASIRYIITFIFPILLGIVANIFFSKFTHKIRAEAEELQKHKG